MRNLRRRVSQVRIRIFSVAIRYTGDSNSVWTGSKWNSMSSRDSINYFFKTTTSCQSKTQITVKKRLKNFKLLEKTIAIRSYLIPTNVVLVPSRTRYALSIPCLIGSLSCIDGLKTGFLSEI